MTQARAHFLVAAWDERLCKEDENGRRVTRVTIRQTFQGDIEGEGVSQYLMTYAPDGTAAFNGLQTIEGRIGGKTGLLMLRLSGDFDGAWLTAAAKCCSAPARANSAASPAPANSKPPSATTATTTSATNCTEGAGARVGTVPEPATSQAAPLPLAGRAIAFGR